MPATTPRRWQTSRPIGRRRMILDARSRPDWHAFGIPRDDRLAVLAHAYGDVHEIYDQYERLPQKRAALEMWERHLRKVTADQPVADEGKVLPLWR